MSITIAELGDCIDNSQLILSQNTAIFDDALAACRTLTEGDLVSFQNQAELDEILDFAPIQAWVGLFDDNTVNDLIQRFEFTDGSSNAFISGSTAFLPPWVSTEPNNLNQDCVQLVNRVDERGIGDRGCTVELQFVCRAFCTLEPTSTPTENPTNNPTTTPTQNPTQNPTTPVPTEMPTKSPTRNPTKNPTRNPTKNPTSNPTKAPTQNPTTTPTQNPTLNPTNNPTNNPTLSPTIRPTANPTLSPTPPTQNPTFNPTNNPTLRPTQSPTVEDDDGILGLGIGLVFEAVGAGAILLLLFCLICILVFCFCRKGNNTDNLKEEFEYSYQEKDLVQGNSI